MWAIGAHPLLPSRVNPSPPFVHAEVDYSDTFLVTPFIGRGQRARKNYVAFVCLVTRAIHLELIKNCFALAFLAVFWRFANCRGSLRHVYSNNNELSQVASSLCFSNQGFFLPGNI